MCTVNLLGRYKSLIIKIRINENIKIINYLYTSKTKRQATNIKITLKYFVSIIICKVFCNFN